MAWVALPTSLAVFSPATFAADVVVVTDSRHPVKTMGGERLIELGETPRIEAELSANLPADPERAAAIVRQRLKQGGTDLQRRIGTAYQGVTDAWSLGVTTIPAVVVDQRCGGPGGGLYCTWTGCTVRTSTKVRHYVPDAVVSSYSNTGENPGSRCRR